MHARLQADSSLLGITGGATNDSSSASTGLAASSDASGLAAAAGGRCAVVYDMQQLTRSRVLPMPVHSVSTDGSMAASINHHRLHAAMPGAGAREYTRWRTSSSADIIGICCHTLALQECLVDTVWVWPDVRFTADGESAIPQPLQRHAA